MRISIIGTGYVGLVSGACLAAQGHRVICVDNDKGKVDRINRGESPIFESGLQELLNRHIGVTLSATSDLGAAVLNSEISLIAVGTPFDGSAIDVTAVKQVAAAIGEALKDKPGYHAVVVKSTVAPGTTDEVVLPIIERASGQRAGADFGVGMNPEFLREGVAVDDFMRPDRIVLGALDRKTLTALREVYAPFAGVDVVETTNKTAEMIKYAANSLLATLISFSNEVANLCASVRGIDVADVMHGVHLDKRFSPIEPDGRRVVPGATTYLEAGCGFGGSCFPKDVQALISHGRRHGSRMRLLESVMEINAKQPHRIMQCLKKHFPSLDGVKVTVLGLAFKPGTDDMRESPAIPVINALLWENAKVNAYDPVAKREAAKIFGGDPDGSAADAGQADIEYCDELAEAIDDAEAVLILTRWDELKDLPAFLGQLDSQPLVVDGRRMLNKDSVARYEGIGLDLTPKPPRRSVLPEGLRRWPVRELDMQRPLRMARRLGLGASLAVLLSLVPTQTMQLRSYEHALIDGPTLFELPISVRRADYGYR